MDGKELLDQAIRRVPDFPGRRLAVRDVLRELLRAADLLRGICARENIGDGFDEDKVREVSR